MIDPKGERQRQEQLDRDLKPKARDALPQYPQRDPEKLPLHPIVIQEIDEENNKLLVRRVSPVAGSPNVFAYLDDEPRTINPWFATPVSYYVAWVWPHAVNDDPPNETSHILLEFVWGSHSYALMILADPTRVAYDRFWYTATE